MPLVWATVKGVSGNAFALDTGSSKVVVLRYFWEHDGADSDALVPRGAPTYTEAYLEGKLQTYRMLSDVVVGGARLTQEPVDVERTNLGDTIEAPIDGIFGVNVLGHFEWCSIAETTQSGFQSINKWPSAYCS